MNNITKLRAQLITSQRKKITTTSQLQVMLLLFENKEQPTSVKNINQASSLTAPAISGILTKLEQLGYIKTTQGTEDKRQRLATLTQKGKWAVDNILLEDE